MLQQICSGMEALAAAGLIHRDLALRNVLVFGYDARDVSLTSVKVSDFGLTVNAYTATAKYVQGGPKPIRYMAPEALEKGRYSEKSDVWSFGVAGWELLTRGSIPYFAINDDDAVIAHVVGGGLLPIPSADKPVAMLWETLKVCFVKKPTERPTFAQLGVTLGQMKLLVSPSSTKRHYIHAYTCMLYIYIYGCVYIYGIF